MSDSQALAQLSFEIDNPKAPNTIYISSDPSVNHLVFKITTDTDGTSFTPGQLVKIDDAPNTTGTNLFLDLSSLNLSPDEYAALTFTDADQNWKYQLGDDFMVCLTPVNNITLNVNQAIEIQIGNFSMENPPEGSNVSLYTTCFRVGKMTIGDMGIPVSFQVLLQNPPNQNDKDFHKVLQATVPQPFILNSTKSYPDVANSLNLVLKPGESPREVKAGDTTSFTVSFVYADQAPGYGALTTPQEASKFQVKAGQNGQNWTITPGDNMQNPSWLLQPPSGQTILGEDGKATVEFLFGNIITSFNQGPTLMILSYKDVPGYQDGSFAISLTKVAHVSIDSFTVSPNPVVLENGEAKITLSWKTSNASSLTLFPLYEVVTGKNSFTTSISETTTFTLGAQGKYLVNEGNSVYQNLTVTVLPKINYFTANPSAIYVNDFPRNVEFSWNVDTAGTVDIVGSHTGTTFHEPAIGTVSATLTGPQMFTLVPSDSQNKFSLTRRQMVAAFDIQTQTKPLDQNPYAVAASPTAGFIAVTNPTQNQVTIVDSITLTQLGDPISVGASPKGIAFSPDGSLMFTANSGDGTVSVIPVTPTGSQPPYRFDNAATVQVGGAPQDITVSPDGTFAYVSIDNGNNTSGSLAVLKDSGNHTFAKTGTVPVGVSPRGLAVSPSGAQIFVANSGDDSVSVVGSSATGDCALVRTITNISSKPTDVGVAAGGDTLMVVCSGSNTVFAIDTRFAGTSPRAPLSVGNQPQKIAVAPGGAYAFVTNQGDSTVSLISCADSYKQCKVLDNTIRVGKDPVDISVSPDNGLVLVADTSDRSLTVLDLVQYKPDDKPLQVGNAPTNIKAVADGSKVFVWHDSHLTVTHSGQPFTGFYVLDTNSGVVSPQMTATTVIDCAFAPKDYAQTGFLIDTKTSGVQVFNTSTYESIHTIPFPTKAGVTQRTPIRLDLSADGTRLFVLVNDGQKQYSLLIYSVDLAHNQYASIKDLPVFTSKYGSSKLMLNASADGSQAFVSSGADKAFYLIQQGTDGTYSIPHPAVEIGSGGSSMTILPDASKAYILNKSGLYNSISVVDTASLTVQTVHFPVNVSQISLENVTISPDGSKMYATDELFSGVRVIDPVSLRFTQMITWGASVGIPFGITVLPDASQIFTANLSTNNIGVINSVN